MELNKALIEFGKFHKNFNQQWEELVIQNVKKDWTLANLKSNIPKTCEIILFGSTATAKSQPNDIDCFILTHDAIITAIKLGQLEVWGYYGTSQKYKQYLTMNYLQDFGFNTRDWQNMDLHFLPTDFFWNKDIRNKYVKAQKDPQFYTKAFSCAWVLDKDSNTLKPITYKTLEQRFA